MTLQRRGLMAGWAQLALSTRPAVAQPVREVHGAHDAWAEPGLALAWGILRGRDEAGTRVLIRIEADPRRWARLEPRGRDPFSGSTTPWRFLQGDGGLFTVDILRSRMADHPRTELRLWAPGAAEPGLLVYFAGLPDTTPEGTTEAQVVDGMKARIERVRASLPR